MPATKKIKVKFAKGMQNEWYAYGYVISDTLCPTICVHAARDEKAASAKPWIERELERMCDEYSARYPNGRRVDEETYETFCAAKEAAKRAAAAK